MSKVANCGQFVGIDGRPLSTDRGVAREIARIYKSYLRSFCSGQQNTATVKDPFLGLHVRCVPGKYDVNVEPSKDDVLFEDMQDLLSSFEGLLCSIYGELKESPRGPDVATRRTGNLPREDGFELLLSRRRSPTSVLGTDDGFVDLQAPLLTPSPQSKFAAPRQTPESTHCRQAVSSMSPQDSDCGSVDDRQFLNPWSIAKINVPSRTPEGTQTKTTPFRPLTTVRRQQEQTETRMGHGIKRLAHSTVAPALLSPASASTISPPEKGSQQRISQFPQKRKEPLSSIRRFLESRRDNERDGNATLGSSLQPTSQFTLVTDAVDSEPEPIEVELPLSQLASQRFSSAQRTPDIVGRQQLTNTRDPEGSERSPVPSVSMGSELPGEMLLDSQELSTCSGLQELLSEPSPSQRMEGNVSAVEEALDFERRKKEAIRKRREQLRGCSSSVNVQAGSNTLNSPHQNRYLAARASLSMQPDSSAPRQNASIEQDSRPSTIFSADDPRAYLIRQRSLTNGAAQHQRAKADKLPLERIPHGKELHTIQMTLPVDLRLLSKDLQEISQTDIYIRSGDFSDAFDDSDIDIDVKSWESRLISLLEHCYGAESETLRDALHLDLRSIFDNTRSTTEDTAAMTDN